MALAPMEGRQREGAMAECDSMQEWASLHLSGLGGMVTRRPMNPSYFQAAADKMAREGHFGKGTGMKRRVHKFDLDALGGFEGITAKLTASLGLPAELREVLLADARAVGEQMLELLPEVEFFDLTVDLLGENICSRWHVDSYIGRAIVTYNSHGTEWADPWNVDFWELENCGNNDCIIRKKDEVHQANVGDIVFMKGSGFEPGKRGLVHKSPAPRFNDGSVVHRFCFKLDAPLTDQVENQKRQRVG